MSDTDDMHRGERIERLLADEDLKWHLQQVEDNAVAVWKSATTVSAREEQHALVRATARLRESFRATINRGVLAKVKSEKGSTK